MKKYLQTVIAILAATIGIAAMSDATAACAPSAPCTPVIPLADFTYSVCDEHSPGIDRTAAWCHVQGGTWNGSTCSGGVPPANSQAAASALGGAFVSEYYGPSCGGGPDPGACGNYYCGCQTTYVGDLVASSFSKEPYSGTFRDPQGNCGGPWSVNIIVAWARPIGCPKGWLGAGDNECTLPPPCEKCVGNPIDVGNSTKRQKEVDYASAAPGGLSFERYYNSAGFFDFQKRLAQNDDYWRHTYSSKVVAQTGKAYWMAAVVRPSGDARYFNLSGVEVQNNDGAAYRLVKLTDGGGAVTGWTLTSKESTVEQFDAQGRLTSITTRSGFVTSLAYDGNGRLQTVTDAYGRSLTLAYDGSDRLSTMTDPSSRAYTYAYDTSGRLSTVTYPDTKVRTYLYESANHSFGLTGIVDERGARYSTYAYNSTGHANSTEHAGFDNKFTLSFTDSPTQMVTTVSDPFLTQNVYTFSKVAGALKLTQHSNFYQGTEYRTYDTNGNPLTWTDRRGYLTTYVFDGTRNLETSRTEASGQAIARTITTTWHATYRLPATITEPSGVAGVNLVTTFTYDSAGNLTKKNMTAGAKVREWNYTVNSRGQVLTVDGPRTDATDATTITYYSDADTCVACRGNASTVTNASGHVTTFNAYNLDGRPTQVTDANGVVTTLAYKPRGWLESRTVAGETTSYDYDAVGNLTLVTLPDGSWVHYLYDAANALVAIDDSMGNVIDYELDVYGNRVQETVFDPQQQLRKNLERVYDAGNRLQSMLGATGQNTTYAYDGNNNVTSVRDPLNHVTTNTYDALNRLTNINDPASGNTVFTYDAKDRLATVKDPKITATTSYTYDGLGNLLTQVSPDTGTTTFTYDNAGNVATQTDARSTATTYGYDVLNRVTAATVTDGTVGYEYDNTTTGGSYAKGRLTKVTDPSGNSTYVYDSLGRVTSKTQTVTATPANKAFTVGYSYANGRQTGITYPSGRAITYGFNAQGQVTSLTIDGTTTILGSAEYFPFGAVKKWTWGNSQAYERTFDLDGQIKTLTLGPSTATYADLSQVFGYDSLNRLVSANLAAGQTQSFTYDANSNRLTATINAALTSYTYPSTNHKLSSLGGATTRSFTYDNAGNITNSQSITYVYDGRGRMKQAGTVTYLVNGLGQRVKKNNGTDIFFAYDETGRLIGEYDATGAAIQETVWLGDQPVATVRPAAPSGFDVFYVWADHLGTPRAVSDTSNVIRWEWAHNDPFGHNAPNENPAGAGGFTYNLRFPGQYFDVETGKHYNYFRDYDPAIGRYIQSDPIGLIASLNTYDYVGSNPLRDSDQRGLAPDSVCVADAFLRNYSNMRQANTIGADKYFHCKANCEGARCSKDAWKICRDISDGREWFDMNVKRDSKAASDADQYANEYGRGWGANTKLDCVRVCEPFRPRGLDRSKY